MKTKKILAGIITIAMLVSAAFIFSVQADDDAAVVPMPMPTAPVIPLTQQKPEYAFVNGKIEEIRDVRVPAGGTNIISKKILTVASGDGDSESKWNITVDSGTYFITGNKNSLKAGVRVRAFYNIKAPSLMIYPPQLNADFIAVNLAEEKSVTIDRFDDKFTDSKNQLKLNIPADFNEKDKTEIVYEDGVKFEGKIEDLVTPSRKLVVIYAVTTRSIPAQTTPEKIIIMYEKAVPPIYIFTEEEKALMAKSLDNAIININGKAIKAQGVFMTDNGILMVPVRTIAEAMGFNVEWFGDTKTVQVGRSLSFVIGKDQYSYNRMAPVSLGAAPVLKDGKTFVPIEFFTMNTIDGINIKYNFGHNAGTADIPGGAFINIESEPAE